LRTLQHTQINDWKSPSGQAPHMHAPREHGGIYKMFAASRRKGTSNVRVYVSATVVGLG